MSRIVLLPSAYLPSLGGVQELTRHLALTLVEAGDDVEVWTQQDDGVAKPSVDTLDGLTVRRFPLPLPAARPKPIVTSALGSVSSLRAIRAAISDFEPDLLHVQCFGPNGAYASAASRLTGVPLIISLQGETQMDDQDIFDVSTTLRTALRLGLRQARAVTACSRFTLEDAEARFGLARGRGQVIFNGVDLDGQDRSAAAHPTDPRYVLALGRMVGKKGFDLLIRAFGSIERRHPEVHLAIGGSGEAEPELRGLVSALHLQERVRFLGRLSRQEVAVAMEGAEVFVMPSRLEPFGIVVLEAWRAGVATIATSRGGPPEYVSNGENGILADPSDVGALSTALDRLLSDDALRAKVAASGHEAVRRFAWPEIAGEYRRLYATVRR